MDRLNNKRFGRRIYRLSVFLLLIPLSVGFFFSTRGQRIQSDIGAELSAVQPAVATTEITAVNAVAASEEKDYYMNFKLELNGMIQLKNGMTAQEMGTWLHTVPLSLTFTVDSGIEVEDRYICIIGLNLLLFNVEPGMGLHYGYPFAWINFNTTGVAQRLQLTEDQYNRLNKGNIITVDIMFEAGYPNNVFVYRSLDGWQNTFFIPNEDRLSIDIGYTSYDTEYRTVLQEENVYDNDGNKLMYNSATGYVYSGEGMVYTSESQPVVYDAKTMDFTVYTGKGALSTQDSNINSLSNPHSVQEFAATDEERLALIQRSTGGVQNMYLTFGKYNVCSIGIDDKLYIASAKADTEYNSSNEPYDILVKRVVPKFNIWDIIFKDTTIRYYDLQGHEIKEGYLAMPTKISAGWNIFGMVSALRTIDSLIKVEPWGTLANVFDECVYLMEKLVPAVSEPGSLTVFNPDFGEFALNPNTGRYLRDNLGSRIRVHADKYLIDVLGYPVLGADARPVFMREDLNGYTNFSGGLLEYSEDNLLDTDGAVVRSVVENQLNGERLYFIYINIAVGQVDPATGSAALAGIRGKYVLPVTGVNIAAGTGNVTLEYYDMNGDKLSANEFVKPDNVDEDDRKVHWPDEFPDTNWWDDLFGKTNAGCGSGCAGNISNILILIIIALVVVVIIYLVKNGGK